MDSRTLDVVIGLVFTFALTAALSSVITEVIARFLGLRARFLLIGLRELLDSQDSPPAELSQVVAAFNGFTTAADAAQAAEHDWDEWATGAATEAATLQGDAAWGDWRDAAAQRAGEIAPCRLRRFGVSGRTRQPRRGKPSAP